VSTENRAEPTGDAQVRQPQALAAPEEDRGTGKTKAARPRRGTRSVRLDTAEGAIDAATTLARHIASGKLSGRAALAMAQLVRGALNVHAVEAKRRRQARGRSHEEADPADRPGDPAWPLRRSPAEIRTSRPPTPPHPPTFATRR
jgi:hypothetical protein